MDDYDEIPGAYTSRGTAWELLNNWLEIDDTPEDSLGHTETERETGYV